MLLDNETAIIKETFSQSGASLKALKFIDTTFSEFSSSQGWLHFHEESQKLRLSLKLPAWSALQERADVMAAFKKVYFEPYLMKKAEDGWDVSIEVAADELSCKEALFTELRSAIIAAPLQAAIEAQKQKNPFQSCTVKLSSNGQEAFTVACQGEQVVFLLSTAFPDQTDIVLARVFLQELFDVRKEGKLGDAPAVLFGREPPADLTHLIPKQRSNGDLNYLSIVLFPRHFDKPEVFKLLPSLRDYLHYHLKCCKAYLHGRMRAKTADFLKILNRAKPENFN